MCHITILSPVHTGDKVRPDQQQSPPSWRQCRPQQAVKFKLLVICHQNRRQVDRIGKKVDRVGKSRLCRRFWQQSTLSPMCTGLYVHHAAIAAAVPCVAASVKYHLWIRWPMNSLSTGTYPVVVKISLQVPTFWKHKSGKFGEG